MSFQLDMKNFLGIVFSFILVFFIIGISTFLDKKKLLSKEATRKFIHIGVSNWWLVAMYFFSGKFYALIAPAIFIILNYLSYKFNIVKAMERESRWSDLGTVYFPISLLLLVILTFRTGSHPYVGAIGILIMGYGDGLAAVIGKKYGRLKFYIFGNEKSLEGTLTMLIASLIVCYVILTAYAPIGALHKSILLAFIATALEFITPLGLDNITVPILTSLLYQFILF